MKRQSMAVFGIVVLQAAGAWAETNQRSQSFDSFSDTPHAGGKGGEIGGLIHNSPSSPAYYADDIGTLSLDQPLMTSGKIALQRYGSDGAVSFGWFNSAKRGYPPANVLGILIDGPTSTGPRFEGLIGSSDPKKGHRQGNAAPLIAADGKSHTWRIEYDPAGEGGKGKMTISLNDKPTSFGLNHSKVQNGQHSSRSTDRSSREFAMLTSSPALFVACSFILAQPVGAQTTLGERLQPLIQAHRGETAVAVKHLKTGEAFNHQADVPMPTASLIKFPVMVEAYRQAAAGKIDLTEKLTFRDEDKTPGSGILSSHFSEGATFSLRDAIRLMIAYSDNTATNLVLQKVSLPATNETMEKLGLMNTKVHGLVFRPQSSILPERSKQFGLGSTTAGEMIKLLELLESGQLVNAAACDEMLEHLRACQDKNRIPKLLPPGTKVAHKTGSVGAVRTAAGIIEAPSGPIALCVLTKDNEDQRWTDENAAELLTAQIARAVYDHFEAGRPAAPVDERLLKNGSTGRLVETLQRTLNARLDPSPSLAVDGDFGPNTEAALKSFQRSKNLRATGEVGPETWKALEPLVEAHAK